VLAQHYLGLRKAFQKFRIVVLNEVATLDRPFERQIVDRYHLGHSAFAEEILVAHVAVGSLGLEASAA
jgi:hypothetical protein